VVKKAKPRRFAVRRGFYFLLHPLIRENVERILVQINGEDQGIIE
jgi:hypothetical protein